MRPIIKQLSACVPALVREFPAIEILYVFGSQASGRVTPHSDIDVAVLVDEEACRRDPLFDLKMSLLIEDILGRSVDVIVLNRASVILQHEVLRTGGRLYESSAARRRDYELACFKAYTDVRYYQHRRRERAAYG